VKNDEREFQAKITTDWFELYKRTVDRDSSAFEHVFIGEVKEGKAEAFHNWINFYILEKKGDLHFEGYLPSKQDGANFKPDPTEHVIPMRLNYKGATKPFSTSFIGTSPEFEFALYTLLFYLGHQDTQFVVKDIQVNVKVYDINRNNTRLIGSAYPEIIGHIQN